MQEIYKNSFDNWDNHILICLIKHSKIIFLPANANLLNCTKVSLVKIRRKNLFIKLSQKSSI